MALLLIALAAPSRTTRWNLRAHIGGSEGTRTTVSFNWHDDPSPEVRALLHNLLRSALALVVALLRLATTLLQHDHQPWIDLDTLHQLRPVVRPARLHRSSHRHVWQPHVTAHWCVTNQG